jgi:hypothetical protein
VDKYPTWKDNTIKPEPVRVVGEDIVPTQEKYTLNTEALEAIKARLTKARTQLILDKPFLGNLVLRLPLVAADSWCKTSLTFRLRFLL